MINQGAYKPVINRSPDERPVASNALKQQFNASRQQQPQQQNQSQNSPEEQCAMSGGVWDAQSNSCLSKRDAQMLDQKRNFQERERLVQSDPNRNSTNFWDDKYNPLSKGKLQGLDKFRDDQLNTNSLEPQTPRIDEMRRQKMLKDKSKIMGNFSNYSGYV